MKRPASTDGDALYRVLSGALSAEPTGMKWNLNPRPERRMVALELKALLALFLGSILVRIGWEIGGIIMHKLF